MKDGNNQIDKIYVHQDRIIKQRDSIFSNFKEEDSTYAFYLFEINI